MENMDKQRSHNNELMKELNVTNDKIKAIFLNHFLDAFWKAVRWSTPFATDNTIGYMLSTNVTSGTRFSVGDTVVQYVAMDLHGNEATCDFTVTVLGKSHDLGY